MNQENKKQIILAGILGTVLVVVLVYQVFIAGGAGTPPNVANNTGSTTSPSSSGSTASLGAASATPERLKQVDVDLDVLLKNIEVVTFDYAKKAISRNPLTPLVGRIRTPVEELALSPASRHEVSQKSVTGIIYNDYKPIAVIDDEVVTEGHQYAGGVILTRIEPKRVWFKWGDAEIPVDLKEF